MTVVIAVILSSEATQTASIYVDLQDEQFETGVTSEVAVAGFPRKQRQPARTPSLERDTNDGVAPKVTFYWRQALCISVRSCSLWKLIPRSVFKALSPSGVRIASARCGAERGITTRESNISRNGVFQRKLSMNTSPLDLLLLLSLPLHRTESVGAEDGVPSVSAVFSRHFLRSRLPVFPPHFLRGFSRVGKLCLTSSASCSVCTPRCWDGRVGRSCCVLRCWRWGVMPFCPSVSPKPSPLAPTLLWR